MSKVPTISSISEKVDLLVNRYEELSQKYDKVSKQKSELESENERLSKRVQTLELKEAVKVVDSTKETINGELSGAATENSVAMERVNQLLREVDRCIALLMK